MWLLVLIASLVCALATPLGHRTLLVFDESNQAIAESEISSPLREQGHSLEIVGVKSHPQLFHLGRRNYDNLIIIPGRTKALGKTLVSKNLVNFLEDGGNVVTLSTPEYSPLAIRELAAQMGVHVSMRGHKLIDHFEEQALDFAVPEILTSEDPVNVADSSVAKLDETNEFVLPLLRAPELSYTSNVDETGAPFVSGRDGVIAAALQARNNARFVWVGAPDLLKGNFGSQIFNWAFQEKGVLRLVDASPIPDSDLFKVYEDVAYCATIEEWDGNLWVPYDSDDVQLEFRMLDPWWRLTLDSNHAGVFCTNFTVPDQHGMFTFSLEYFRPGKSFISDKKVVTVRHNANDEWPRSWTISNSWVYLAGITTTVIAFLAFLVLSLSL